MLTGILIRNLGFLEFFSEFLINVTRNLEKNYNNIFPSIFKTVFTYYTSLKMQKTNRLFTDVCNNKFIIKHIKVLHSSYHPVTIILVYSLHIWKWFFFVALITFNGAVPLVTEGHLLWNLLINWKLNFLYKSKFGFLKPVFWSVVL
jgi:hypothetical protein